MIAGFMFCVGVLLFFVCLGVVLMFLREILIIIAVLAVVAVGGFLWLIVPDATEAFLALGAGIAVLCGGCWGAGWVWDYWLA